MSAACMLGEEALALREEKVEDDLCTIGYRRPHL
jgi:hypothetical protein